MAADADDYQKFLQEAVFPALRRIDGYHGGYIFRHDGAEESEFVVTNLFESMDAVKAFAGRDYDVPVLEPEARRLLTRVEPVARHYDVKEAPAPARS